MFGGRPITLFHVRGIRIAVDWSWFLILFLVIFWMTQNFEELLGKTGSQTTPFLLGLASAAGFFGSILLHELGHAFVARRNGIGISSIQLWIFGGMARMDREADSPGVEARVALAGPAVTALIFVVCVAIGIAGGGWTEFRDAALFESRVGEAAVPALFDWLASINLLLLLFNLIPAFPMDGGRVARAIAWRRTGDRNAATRFAADLGRILGWGIVAAGVYMAVTDSIFGSFGGIWLALIGVMITGAAKGASRQTQVSGRIHHISVADVMDRQPVAIPGDISVEQALDQYFLRYRWPWFPVVDAAHRFLGLLQRETADDVPEVSRTVSLVSDIVDHDRGLFVRDDTPLDSLLSNANLRRFGALMAVDADGRLSGVITVEQLGRALKDATTFTGP
ncbi:MAG TPA: site-2 protease family protein [Solirubrobacterales bacterium]|jgi:Zn-dependent protease|nr:site-2 protease family protein [Solirubrobacterales bacterium]